MVMENNNPLELSAVDMRSMVEEAMSRIVGHIESLADQPAAMIEEGPALARSLVEPLPEAGTPYGELLDFLFERVVPCSFNTAGPGYLAYIPGGGLFHSAVADLIADSVNRYVGVWLAAPGLVQLETNVVRWFCDFIGYPQRAGGVLTTGGSLANLTAIVTARRERLPEQFFGGTIYTSDQTHHSVQKAAVLAGFPPTNVREIPSDDRFCIRIDELVRHIEEDREAGFTPFFIVGNGGTTNTGAVDDLEAVADVAEREKMWLHIDAAYGGFFVLTERGRTVLRGIDRADSVTLDPHKGLFLPYGTGSLLVRDAEALRRAHTTFADYMPAMQEEHDLVDFCQISPELSRDFRGLRVWLPIKMHGIEPFRQNLDEKLDLTEWATVELEKIPEIEVLTKPQLSLVAFRLSPAELGPEELNGLNQDFLDRINRRKRVWLTGTAARGRFALRICVLSFRTHRDRMEACLEDVREAARECLGPSVRPSFGS